MVKLIDQLVKFFERSEEETKADVPEGMCPVCWGYQEYDHKIRKLFIDKQIDVKNHKSSYLVIEEFLINHIDGIKLREGKIEKCPSCGDVNSIEETNE